MRGNWALTSSAFVAVTIVACATAGGEFNAGTEKFDASQPPTPGQVCLIEQGSGDTWSDLHRDLFGPNRRPGSCSFQANCHGAPDHPGAKASFGFVCGANKDECRQKMIDTFLLTPETVANPQSANLIGILRTRNPDGSFKGIMPQDPRECYFTEASIARITSWIGRGFPND